jgi:electron transport complex protein RnfD
MCLMTKRKMTILDGSAVITGLLFAFNLPPNSPWFLVAIGSFFAIAIVKWAFGGLGYNIMNPALGGRIFVLAAWSSFMIKMVAHHSQVRGGGRFDAGRKHEDPRRRQFGFAAQQPQDALQAGEGAADAVSTATVSATNMLTTASNWVTNGVTNVVNAVTSASPAAVAAATPAGNYGYTYMDMFLGNIPGCIGETSALALLIGFVYLMVRKVIMPTIPVIYIGVVAFSRGCGAVCRSGTAGLRAIRSIIFSAAVSSSARSSWRPIT